MNDETHLASIIEDIAHYLPAQGPITVFIHHNTLHAFTHLPFEQAVVEAAELHGCEPFLSEQYYRDALARGRIQADDLVALLAKEADAALPFGSRRELRRLLLLHPVAEEEAAALAWRLSETDALVRWRKDLSPDVRMRLNAGFRSEPEAVRALWDACRELVWHLHTHVEGAGPERRARAPLGYPAHARSSALADLVHPVMIRLGAAFLDQGIANWNMPARETGFFHAGLATVAMGPAPLLDPWRRHLRKVCRNERASGRDAMASIAHSLAVLGVEKKEHKAYLLACALELRGWAGMMYQAQVRPDRLPAEFVPARFADWLAVWLVVEQAARAILPESKQQHSLSISASPAGTGHQSRAQAWNLFNVAQLFGQGAAAMRTLSRSEAADLLHAIEDFDGLERRRILHAAFEWRYRNSALSALAREPSPTSDREPTFAVVTCLDDREESLRRHLEAVAPECETFGVAGFFNVAMSYRGIGDAFPRPQCPVAIRPAHAVEEVSARSHAGTPGPTTLRRRKARQSFGRLREALSRASRSFVLGAGISVLVGALSILPLVFRVLFPRLTARARSRGAKFLVPAKNTRIELEAPGSAHGLPGYSLEERAALVHDLLLGSGMARGLARTIFVLGHGSSNLNNPHESAYQCGACGGSRGGPNARAFALMANDPRVRALVGQRGLSIPAHTIFIGGEHDSCRDQVQLFDLDLLEPERRKEARRLATTIDRACAHNAQERCRRFLSAPTRISLRDAKHHVEHRSEDLAQPRPELNHATNALCVVGRRIRTRGLFLDRRCFLVSYDSTLDPEAEALVRTLTAVTPVVVGINLEYFFSATDPVGYGCGSKLPHNVVGMLGVMDGHMSDLRTGLSLQMVEIHEPLRLTLVVECSEQGMARALARVPSLRDLALRRWLFLARLDPHSANISVFEDDRFVPFENSAPALERVSSSHAWFSGHREHLAPALVGGADE